jgi:hypothetical protein
MQRQERVSSVVGRISILRGLIVTGEESREYTESSS